jgi:hypothetical protein
MLNTGGFVTLCAKINRTDESWAGVDVDEGTDGLSLFVFVFVFVVGGDTFNFDCLLSGFTEVP